MKANLRLTYAVIGVCLGILLAYDIWAQISGGLEVTVSTAWWMLAKEFPLATFALGFVMSHLVFKSNGADVVNFDRLKFSSEDFGGDIVLSSKANTLLMERFKNLGAGK